MNELEAEKDRLEHQFRMAQLEKGSGTIVTPLSTEGVVRPSLPVLKDDDGIASYLIRLERDASLFGVDQVSYGVHCTAWQFINW